VEPDDTLEDGYKLLDVLLSKDIQSVDEKLKQRLDKKDKTLLQITRGLLKYLQVTNRWDDRLAKTVNKQVDVFYDQFAGVHKTLSQIIERLSELSSLKPDLEKLRKQLEDQKPTIEDIKKAFEQKKKWLNENK
jgi:predicted ribosome quality control (RQC) complex YloA/Tae2 family protein